jgi:hypothetical protein
MTDDVGLAEPESPHRTIRHPIPGHPGQHRGRVGTHRSRHHRGFEGSPMLIGRLVGIRPMRMTDLGFLAELANTAAVRNAVVGWDWPVAPDAQRDWLQPSWRDPRNRRFTVMAALRSDFDALSDGTEYVRRVNGPSVPPPLSSPPKVPAQADMSARAAAPTVVASVTGLGPGLATVELGGRA